MKYDSIIIDLQNEYKELLLFCTNEINAGNYHLITDEINIFWQIRKKKIEFILNYHYKSYHTYIYIGATSIDLHTMDHLKLLILGKKQIYDDPIYQYIYASNNVENEFFKNDMIENVYKCIHNNLELFEKCPEIIILPVRFLFYHDLEIELANTLFLKLFKNIKDIDDYFYSCPDFNTIKSKLINHDYIIFDEPGGTLDERFEKIKNNKSLNLYPTNSDSFLFYNQIISILLQIIQINKMYVYFDLRPFIRNKPYLWYSIFFFKTLLINLNAKKSIYHTVN